MSFKRLFHVCCPHCGFQNSFYAGDTLITVDPDGYMHARIKDETRVVFVDEHDNLRYSNGKGGFGIIKIPNQQITFKCGHSCHYMIGMLEISH